MNYKKILLKLSGDFFGQAGTQGLDFNAVDKIAQEIIALQKQNIQIGIVNGAGNIFRGRNRPKNFDESAAHQIGYMATLPNSMALAEVLNNYQINTHLMCSFTIPGIARQFDLFKARKLLNKNEIVIFTGGTGHPFFSTDTAAVLRALEIKADILLKATNIDGVYTADPKKNPQAKKIDQLTYQKAIEKNLRVMDQTALAMARDNKLKTLVFKFQPSSLVDIIKNPQKGTVIS